MNGYRNGADSESEDDEGPAAKRPKSQGSSSANTSSGQDIDTPPLSGSKIKDEKKEMSDTNSQVITILLQDRISNKFVLGSKISSFGCNEKCNGIKWT